VNNNLLSWTKSKEFHRVSTWILGKSVKWKFQLFHKRSIEEILCEWNRQKKCRFWFLFKCTGIWIDCLVYVLCLDTCCTKSLAALWRFLEDIKFARLSRNWRRRIEVNVGFYLWSSLSFDQVYIMLIYDDIIIFVLLCTEPCYKRSRDCCSPLKACTVTFIMVSR